MNIPRSLLRFLYSSGFGIQGQLALLTSNCQYKEKLTVLVIFLG